MVLSRDRLLELAWQGEFPGGTRTVDVHIAQLRAKLGRADLVETVRGTGYKCLPRCARCGQRLSIAILGAVLLAVGASPALESY